MKAALDLAYYPHRTLLGDLAWVVRGILVVFGLYPTLRQLPPAQPPLQTEAPLLPRISRLAGAGTGGLHARPKT